MTISGSDIGEALGRLFSRVDADGDWAAVVRDAVEAPPSRRARRAFVAAAALVAALVATLSVAAAGRWWFFASGGAPAVVPGTSVVVVERGESRSTAWTISAYRSVSDGLCFAFTPTAGGAGAGMACTPFVGVPVTKVTKRTRPLSITYLETGLGALRWVIGPVVATAVSVELSFSDGTAVRTQTFDPPAALGARVRFYETELPPGAVLTHVAAFDGGGRKVASLDVRS